MKTSLTLELEQMIADRAKNEQLRQRRVAKVRNKIDRALKQLDRGEGIPGPEARARLRQARNVK